MKIKYVLLLSLALVFVAKYMELASLIMGEYPYAPSGPVSMGANVILVASAAYLTGFSYLKLRNSERYIASISGAIALALSAVLFAFYSPAAYLFGGIFLVISLFVFLFHFHHYEIKKYPAFGSAFLMIYCLMESITIWRGSYDYVVFGVYLTLSLIMFIPGLLKIREDQEK